MNEPHYDSELPPTQYELDQQRHAKLTAENDRRERIITARANRKDGNPEPKVDDKIYVIPERGIKQRTRAGIRFDGTSRKRTEVSVIDASDAEVLVAQREGKNVVNVWGAERIIADTALTVYQSPAIEQDVELLRGENEGLKAELATARAELAKAKEVRDARRAARDAGDGSPSRLPAGAAKAASQTEDEFGAPKK